MVEPRRETTFGKKHLPKVCIRRELFAHGFEYDELIEAAWAAHQGQSDVCHAALIERDDRAIARVRGRLNGKVRHAHQPLPNVVIGVSVMKRNAQEIQRAGYSGISDYTTQEAISAASRPSA